MMKSILNQLYRSEIRPDEEDKPLLEELIEARRAFVNRREALLAEMEEPMRGRVRTLLEERLEVAALEMEDAYVRGMRMGAKMAMALMDRT